MVWQERKDVIHGGKRRWKILSLAVIFLIFVVLVKLLIISVSLDPVIPILIAAAIILLIPVAVFIIDLYYCDAM